jgi:PleD family two-component response regulator
VIGGCPEVSLETTLTRGAGGTARAICDAVAKVAYVDNVSSVSVDRRRLLDQERARAAHDSLHDAITGVPTRALFATRATEALGAAHRADRSVAILVVVSG